MAWLVVSKNVCSVPVNDPQIPGSHHISYTPLPLLLYTHPEVPQLLLSPKTQLRNTLQLLLAIPQTLRSEEPSKAGALAHTRCRSAAAHWPIPL
jgi:hypothetical protein